MNKYSTFWRRFWAEWIDILVFLPWIILNHFVRRFNPTTVVLICWVVLYFVVFRAYKIVLHARYGQTVGKAVTRIRVMNVAENRLPTATESFLREIGSVILSGCILGYWIYLISIHNYSPKAIHASVVLSVLYTLDWGWIALELVSMLTNSKRRAIHDLIAGTVVVRTTSEPSAVFPTMKVATLPLN